jgi:hypothetical protein
MPGPLLFGALVALAVLIGFVALWRMVRSRDPVEARLKEYGADATAPAGAGVVAVATERRTWKGVDRLLAGFGLGPRLAAALAGADVP